MMDFRTSYLETTFNPAFPHLQDVPFFSYGGRSFEPGEPSPHFLKRMRRVLLRKMSRTLETAYQKDGKPGLHDGIVPLESTSWGQFMGVLEADHLEQVLGNGRFPNTNFYRAHLDMLRALEYASIK
jgi:hypothetical protein